MHSSIIIGDVQILAASVLFFSWFAVLVALITLAMAWAVHRVLELLSFGTADSSKCTKCGNLHSGVGQDPDAICPRCQHGEGKHGT